MIRYELKKWYSKLIVELRRELGLYAVYDTIGKVDDSYIKKRVVKGTLSFLQLGLCQSRDNKSRPFKTKKISKC